MWSPRKWSTVVRDSTISIWWRWIHRNFDWTNLQCGRIEFASPQHRPSVTSVEKIASNAELKTIITNWLWNIQGMQWDLAVKLSQIKSTKRTESHAGNSSFGWCYFWTLPNARNISICDLMMFDVFVDRWHRWQAASASEFRFGGNFPTNESLLMMNGRGEGEINGWRRLYALPRIHSTSIRFETH